MQFMHKYKIPGLSIAIAKQGHIILAKGYGFADLDKKIPVNIMHKFRIASISKPITAVAIMKLREQGKLSLDDKVFGKDGILANDYSVEDQLLEKITVRHLLEHTAGKEWSNETNDPMFAKSELSQAATIRWVLKNRRLTKTPGTEYAYSNFGYCVLGRVIEKLGGIGYQYYVRKNIFIPIGAKSFSVGSKKPANSLFQVRYYSDTDENPYWFSVERMDSHGGWIANAIDLVNFSLSVDGRGKNLLNMESIKLMTTASKQNSNYALGWNVNQYNNWWHMGSLPGSASILVRTEQGYNWAVLLNKRSEDKNFFGDLDRLAWGLISDISVLQ
jgi:CubicO group peptidase (beta-lactamase class C family)